ncbi:hypothetical protein [Pseudomonas asplenii]|uniref:hypothetical protein n=1 Tax=Pseudomonas asplenii TaxID=53407 RepID=UPI0003618E5B|nr:hypothetical protein [Pseudomonas fuscovaginae]
MPTENRSSNEQKMVSVPRELAERIVSHCKFWHDHPYLEAIGDIGGKFRTLLDAPAAQHQGEPVSYPPCDYCGIVPDYHPWHGSGLLGGVENRHIHACDGCRNKLPAVQHQSEPVAWRVATGNSYRTYDFLSDAKAAITHWKRTFPNGEVEAEPLYTRPAPVHQGDPVGWLGEGGTFYPSIESARKYLPEGQRCQPLYTHSVPVQQGEPVACRYRLNDGTDRAWTYRDGVVPVHLSHYELEELYKNADSGEVERLRKENELLRHDVGSFLETAAKTCDLLGIDIQAAQSADGKPSDVLFKHTQALRAKLAEREALLKRVHDADMAARHHQPYNTSALINDIEAALSASAEPIPFPGYPPVPEDRKFPNAPVERDERADTTWWRTPERDAFEEWAEEEAEIRECGSTIGLSTEEHTDRYCMIWTQTAWVAWQARAALERKSR